MMLFRAHFINIFSIQTQLKIGFDVTLFYVTTKVCTWHGNTAVTACAKFHSDKHTTTYKRAEWTFSPIWITMEKSFVKCASDQEKTSWIIMNAQRNSVRNTSNIVVSILLAVVFTMLGEKPFAVTLMTQCGSHINTGMKLCGLGISVTQKVGWMCNHWQQPHLICNASHVRIMDNALIIALSNVKPSILPNL